MNVGLLPEPRRPSSPSLLAGSQLHQVRYTTALQLTPLLSPDHPLSENAQKEDDLKAMATGNQLLQNLHQHGQSPALGFIPGALPI